MRKVVIIAGVLFSLMLSLTGCYRLDIQQGNELTAAQIAKVQKGMTTRQVMNAIGDPVLNNIYVEKRLIYVYTFKPGVGRYKEKRFIIYFNKSGRVTDTVVDTHPAEAALPSPNKTKE